MKKAAYIFLTFLLPLCNYAQEVFVAPPAKLITRFHFRMISGGIILMKGTINNLPDSLNFILDTGSGGISLDSTRHKRLNLPLTPSDRTIRGLGGVKNVSFAMNNTLRLPGLTIDSLNFHINNYELLTSVYGIPIDGIIGYSVLSRYIVKLNYDSLYIEFYNTGSIRYPRDGFMMRPLISKLPVVPGRIQDNNTIASRFYFDSGAGLSLLLSEDFARDSSIISSKRKPVETQGEGLGGKLDMKLTVVRELKFGPYKFRNVPTFIFEDEYNVTSYPFLGGLIGNDFLRRFNVIFNYESREFYLSPNSHFREKFDYSYTGLGIYYIDGQIEVTDVIKKSPGEKAGFIPGDIIIGVGKLVYSDILTYKNLLQNTTSSIKVIIMRDGKLKELQLKPRNIMKRK